MKKNVLHAAIITLFTALAVLLICARPGDPDSSGFLVWAQIIDADQYENILKNGIEREFSPDLLTFNGVPAVCDLESRTYYLPQSLESEEFEGELAAASGSGAIYFLDEGAFHDKGKAIENGYGFSFVLCEGNSVMRGTIVFTGMPAMSISYTDGDVLRKEEHAGRIVLSCADNGTPEYTSSVSDCIFHARGSSSYLFQKKSYRVSLYTKDGEKKKVNYLGLRNDDDWILNSIYTDGTRAREMTAYRLWDMVNAWEQKPVSSSKLEYVELFLNHKYAGIYALMVPVDGKQMQMNDGDILYKTRMWIREYGAEGVLTDYNGSSEIPNGGGYNYALIKYPNQMSSNYNWQPLMLLQNFVTGDCSIEDLKEQGIVINRENMVLHNLFIELTGAMDNTWKNAYIAAYKTGPDSYELYHSVWDLNYIFGDEYLWDLDNLNTKFSKVSSEILKGKYNVTYVYERYSEVDDSLWEESQELWKSWRERGLSSQVVVSMLADNRRYLKESGAREREDLLYPEASGGSSYEEIYQWIDRRFEFLDEYYGYDSQQ